MVRNIIDPAVQKEKAKIKKAFEAKNEEALRLKNTIWNKVLNAHEFERFNDQEYFRWMEIYKDAQNNLSNLNPVSIEQKMAMIEVINSSLIPNAMGADKVLLMDVQKLSAYKLKILEEHLKDFNPDSKLTRGSLEEFAADLMLILKGPPVSLMDYFTKNKTVRMNERLMRMIQEDVLLMGLKGMVDRIPEKDSYTQLEKSRYMVKSFFQHKMWKYFVFPYDLPWFEKVAIPDELLEKIMVDGLLAHNQELITHLQKQGMIDHYERFRKVYKPMAFSIAFYFYYEKFSKKNRGELNLTQEQEKKAFFAEFKKLGDLIIGGTQMTAVTVDSIKEEQFRRLLQKFKDKYKTEPTPNEYEEIRSQVFRD